MTNVISTALMGILFYSGATTTGPEWAKPIAERMIEAPKYQTLNVELTGYNAVPEQTDDTPFITATGLRVNPQVGAAASRDLIAGDLPYGTIIELVPGTAEVTRKGCELSAVEDHVQYRVITDTMHIRRNNHVDIQFDTDHSVFIGGRTLSAAKALGWCNDVEIRIIGRVELTHVPETQSELKLLIAQQRLFALND